MEIRILTAGDLEAFRATRLSGLHECPGAFAETPEEFEKRPREQLSELLRNRDEEEGRFILGAFEGEELCGVLGLERFVGEKLEHIAKLRGMYVRPEHRKKGLAKALVEEAIERVRKIQGIDHLKLCVESTNVAAEKLYESFGFRHFGTEPGAIRSEGRCFDEHHMILENLSQ